MALLWIGNPDRYLTANLPLFFDSAHASATVTASGYDSRPGWTASGVSGYVTKAPRSQVNTVTFGFGGRIKLSGIPAVEKVIFAAIDGAGAMQASVSISTTGYLKLWRGNMSTLLATALAPLTTAVWYRLGFTGTIAQAGGSLSAEWSTTSLDGQNVRINNADTAQEAVAIWTGMYLGLSSDWIVSMAYILDGSGSQVALMPGLYVASLTPDSDLGSPYNEWEPTGSATLFGAVDDANHDGDATKITSLSEVGARYAIGMSTLAPPQAVIRGIQQTAVARNVVDSGLSGSHELTVIVDGTSQHVDPWQSVISDAWRVLTRMWATNPVTGLPWTVAEVNAAYWGGKLQS